MNARSGRKKRGQSIVELAVGLIFLVPIVLFLLDMAVVVCANMANDNLAKSCCRAAASAVDNTQTPVIGTAAAANKAAITVAGNFAASAIINPVSGGSFLTGFGYLPPLPSGNAVLTGTTSLYPGPLPPQASAPAGLSNTADANNISTGKVGCVTTMVVTLPVPFPFLPNSFTFASVDIEPIVSPQPGM
jgi:hypothetical protein